MAKHTITAPGTRPEAPGRTRRDLFAAAGATALAGIAAAAFAQPEAMGRPETGLPTDAALLAACAAFQAANAEQERSNAAPGWDDDEITAIGDRWYGAIEDIIASPAPQTNAGRAAIALAARVALVDQVTGKGEDHLDELASAEERLVLAALDSIAEG